MNGYYALGSTVNAIAYSQMNNGTVKKLWNSFCMTQGNLKMDSCDEFLFRIGDTILPSLKEGKEYAIAVDQSGVAIVGKDYGGLMRGFFALIMKIEPVDTGFAIRFRQEESNYVIRNRMIHICVFPENDLYFIKKLIRLSALCQYTHIVIEFWGMLQYDCLKELAWPQAFTKEHAHELIRECNALGIEPVPMFNQLGHATGSRGCYGKHVVLDQNPQLYHLFTPDGWAWNIESDEVRKLLANVRKELYDLFGKGDYIHIGCDEALYISRNVRLRKMLPDYLCNLTNEVEAEGRRAMIWMDMLLEKDVFEDCYSVGEKDEVEDIRNATAKSTVFVDWQYFRKATPVPSLISLKNSGRDVMGAPWYEPENQRALVDTVTENEMLGIMLTTWHTLKEKMTSVAECAKMCGSVFFDWQEYAYPITLTATLLRRLSFENNSYADCGWAKEQVEV